MAVAKTIHYTADEVKAGDYIYSGRSTSDGGLRKRYPNGKAQVIADPKTQSVAGKTVAGVVFCIPKDTDPTGRLTPARLTDDKIMMKDFPNAEIWNYIVNPSLIRFRRRCSYRLPPVRKKSSRATKTRRSNLLSPLPMVDIRRLFAKPPVLWRMAAKPSFPKAGPAAYTWCGALKQSIPT